MRILKDDRPNRGADLSLRFFRLGSPLPLNVTQGNGSPSPEKSLTPFSQQIRLNSCWHDRCEAATADLSWIG